MATTVEQIVNQALMAARRTKRIADIYEGSENARVAIELYGQTRDEILRERNWEFSRRILPLTLIKGPLAPGEYSPSQIWVNTLPRPGYLYEYAYPADCLDLRAIIEGNAMLPDLDPIAENFAIDNDNALNPPAKVILCNVVNAIGVYRAQIIDMTTWEPLFTKTLVESLGAKFVRAFGDDINDQRQGQANEQVATAAGQSVKG